MKIPWGKYFILFFVGLLLAGTVPQGTQNTEKKFFLRFVEISPANNSEKIPALPYSLWEEMEIELDEDVEEEVPVFFYPVLGILFFLKGNFLCEFPCICFSVLETHRLSVRENLYLFLENLRL